MDLTILTAEVLPRYSEYGCLEYEYKLRAIGLSHDVDFHSFEELLCCTHEEADTWMALHFPFSFRNGFERMTVCANDTDVVVALVYQFPRLLDIFPGGNVVPQLLVKFPNYYVPIDLLIQRMEK